MKKALVVSDVNVDYVFSLVKKSGFSEVEKVFSEEECKSVLKYNDFDLIVIELLMSENLGTELAKNLVKSTTSGIIFIINKNEKDFMQDELNFLHKSGVFVMENPFDACFFEKALVLLQASRNRISFLEKQNRELQKKIDEIQLVDRAKCVLIQYLNMTEEQAHRFIEKQSMNLRQSRLTTAENILKTYDN